MISLPLSPRHRPALRILVYAGLASLVLWLLLHLSFDKSTPWTGFPDAERSPIPSEEWETRAERVKEAFLHAYHGYEKYAMPKDELRPVSNKGMNSYNGWGVTVFDSLDTMLLMELKEEYTRALEVVKAANFTMTRQNRGFVPFFETTIRYLGGLLSAYALTNDTLLLRRAEELADALDPVFETPHGLPAFSVNPISGEYDKNDVGILAELGSFQVEYTYLAKASGKKKYYDRVKNLNDFFHRTNLTVSRGMLPTRWNLQTGLPRDPNKVSVGAQADSTHEYFLKQYLLTGKTDKRNLESYLRTTTYILTNLLYLTPRRGLLYVTDTTFPTYDDPAGVPSHTFEHLSCFLPGLLALGAHTLPLNNLEGVGLDYTSLGDGPLYNGTSQLYKALKDFDLKQLHLWAAEGIAQTCWLTYADQPCGLGPEEVLMLTEPARHWDAAAKKWVPQSRSYLWTDAMRKWKKGGARGPIPGVSPKRPAPWTEEDRAAGKPNERDYHVWKAGYLLRPETVESFYLLWRTTGDVKWRTRGWAIFEAVERETRTNGGYVTLKNVATSPTMKGDSMPSFFLAETLKYLYLLFKEDDPLPLDRWVFSTEAHAVPVFEWTDEEREGEGLIE